MSLITKKKRKKLVKKMNMIDLTKSAEQIKKNVLFLDAAVKATTVV